MGRNSFNWSGDIWVDVDVNYDDALEAIPEEYIREWLGTVDQQESDSVGMLLADPVKRLEIIAELRKEYTVEPR